MQDVLRYRGVASHSLTAYGLTDVGILSIELQGNLAQRCHLTPPPLFRNERRTVRCTDAMRALNRQSFFLHHHMTDATTCRRACQKEILKKIACFTRQITA